MRRRLGRVGLLCLLLVPGTAQADGGMVRVSEKAGGYRLTVFTAPTPLRAGPVDVSVLLQEAATTRPIPDARVTLRLTPIGRSAPVIRRAATAAQAVNKLLYAAKFDLPDPGAWLAEVEVEGPAGSARVSFPLQAAAAQPRWLDLWVWVTLPAVPVLLFLLNHLLRRLPGRQSGS